MDHVFRRSGGTSWASVPFSGTEVPIPASIIATENISLSRPARKPISAFILAAAMLCAGISSSPAIMAAESVSVDEGSDGHDRWSFQVGTAAIMHNVIDDFVVGRFNRASGPAGGEVYLFQTSCTLRDLSWTVRERTFEPQLELPFVLGIVNENGRSPFYDIKIGLTLRWKDFPWNSHLYTNLESGVGLSYTEHVYRIERVRHPDRTRSHLKFYLPIQLTLAHPRHRQHQAVIFLHHHSGGRIIERGGTNAIGIGYRYVFRER